MRSSFIVFDTIGYDLKSNLDLLAIEKPSDDNKIPYTGWNKEDFPMPDINDGLLVNTNCVGAGSTFVVLDGLDQITDTSLLYFGETEFTNKSICSTGVLDRIDADYREVIIQFH